MTQETHKPKTLSISKPLSLDKEAEIFKTFGKEGPKIAQKQNLTKLETAKDQNQISDKLKSQQDKNDIKHKQKKQTSNCLFIEKEGDINKNKGQKQVSRKLSSQEEKAARYEIAKQRQERRQEALIWLKDTFPACFNLNHPQPLKIGIFDDILHLLEEKDPLNLPTRVSLRKAMRYYSENHLYHKAILTSPHRYDLKGDMAQDVTDQERDYAKIRLDLLEARYKRSQEHKKSS